MELKDLFMWASIISSPILSVIAIVGHLNRWASSGEEALRSKQASQESKLVDHDRRIQSIEGELKHLPTKDQVNDLKLAISELGGAVSTMKETVTSVQRTVHRIDDWLREDSKVG